MCDKEQLVEYLYDEMDAAARRNLEAHLACCAACRAEVAAMRGTRRHLASWAPAEPQLGFEIVTVAPARRRRLAFSPAWGLAAAAVLVLAAATAIANVEVRYGADGLVVRTGWARGATPVAVQPAAPAPAVTPAEWTAAINTLEQRLRELERRPQPAGLVQASGPRVTDAEVLRRWVRELLTESETRQDRQLALRIRQLATELDTQRRVDLAAIQQGIQGATGVEEVRHRELVNYVNGLYRVSLQGK